MLKKVYIEITNICNLSCSFCPKTARAPRRLSAEEFRTILHKLRPHTEYVYLHVMGEPLLHPQLSQMLEACRQQGMKVCLTTNGTLLEKRRTALLTAPALHKISVSLHCAEANPTQVQLQDYLQRVFPVCRDAAANGIICALRLWNEGGKQDRNGEILDFIRANTSLWQPMRNGSVKLGENLYLDTAEKFEWPDLAAEEQQTQFCYGLRDQAAILSDGTVVPCCLDHEGDIALGNIFEQSFDEILESDRARALYQGFSCRRPTEELCRRCGYAARFNK